jgi:hypothetical protein
MKTKAFMAAFVACVTLIPLVSVRAANASTYTLVGIGCSTEDCSMTGTFDYNGSFSNIDISMTGTVFSGSVFSSDQGSTATQLFIGDNHDDYWVLNFAQRLAVNGGNDAITSGCGFSTTGPADPAGCTFFYNTFGLTGSVQSSVSALDSPPASVPGPVAGAGLPGLVFGCGGFLVWRRKKRNVAGLLAPQRCSKKKRPQRPGGRAGPLNTSPAPSPCELFTSALADRPCITRGRCGSLLLHRDGLPPSTFCRSPGAPVHHIISDASRRSNP